MGGRAGEGKKGLRGQGSPPGGATRSSDDCFRGREGADKEAKGQQGSDGEEPGGESDGAIAERHASTGDDKGDLLMTSYNWGATISLTRC